MNLESNDFQKKLKQDISGIFTGKRSEQVKELHKLNTEQLKEFLKDCLKEFGAIGYLDIGLNNNESEIKDFPDETTGTIVGEELACISPSLFLSIETGPKIFGWLISAFGSKKDKSDFLNPLKKGEIIGAVALTEDCSPFMESDLKTTGLVSKDGFILNGQKKMVINAPIADMIAVVGSVDGKTSVFMLDQGQKGLKIESRIKTLGFNGMSMADINLDNCFVPKDRVLGPFEDTRLESLIKIKENHALSIASLGVMKRAFAEAKLLANIADNGRKPAMAFQEIRFKLAEMFTLCQTSLLMLFHESWLLESNDAEAVSLSACTKVFISEAAEEVSSKAIQVISKQGFIAGSIAEECYRDAKFGQIAGQTSEMLRMKIADDCLAKY